MDSAIESQSLGPRRLVFRVVWSCLKVAHSAWFRYIYSDLCVAVDHFSGHPRTDPSLILITLSPTAWFRVLGLGFRVPYPVMGF